jgi:LacI family transcriptional regulator
MRNRITIDDVAKAAGVSRQTVTRAMKDMAEISPETRARVLRIADELGYRPSRFASNLASRQKGHAIGLVITSFRNPYFSELAAEILDVAAARGWQVVMSSREQGGDLELIATLSGQVDAIFGYFDTDDQTALVNAARGVPIVLFERIAVAPGTHSVDLDFHRGIETLLAGLRSRGASRFGLIDSDPSGRPGGYRPTQRRLAYEELAGEDSAHAVVVADTSISGGADGFRRLRTRFPDLDAVLVFNDLMAMGAIQSAHLLGVAVPQDVRIVGIDGLTLGAVMSPPLSTLSIDRRAVATAAVEIFATLLEENGPAPHPPITRYVVPRPLWRDSA